MWFWVIIGFLAVIGNLAVIVRKLTSIETLLREQRQESWSSLDEHN